MKHALLSVVFGLFLASTATADEMPTFKLLMKGGRILPETLEVPANTRFRLEVKNEGPAPAVKTAVDVAGTVRFVADDANFWLEPGEARTVRLRVRMPSPAPASGLRVSASAWNAAAK